MLNFARMSSIVRMVALPFAISVVACSSSMGESPPPSAPEAEPPSNASVPPPLQCSAAGARCRYEDDCCSRICVNEETCGG
jgi:hypothetical protein